MKRRGGAGKIVEKEDIENHDRETEIFHEMAKKMENNEAQAALVILKTGYIEVACNSLQAIGAIEALLSAMEADERVDFSNVRQALLKNPYSRGAIEYLQKKEREKAGDDAEPLLFDELGYEDFHDEDDEPGVLN